MMTIRERIAEAKQAEMLTVEQLALLTQYHPQTIYRMAARKQIPGTRRYGRGIRFIRILALQWGSTHTRRARPEPSV